MKQTILMLIILAISYQLTAQADESFSSDLVLTYEVKDRQFVKIVPFYSYLENSELDKTPVIFRASNGKLSYDQETERLFLTISGHPKIMLAEVSLTTDTDRLFPNVRVNDIFTINKVVKKEGRRYKVKMCGGPIMDVFPFFSNCITHKVRAYVEITEVVTMDGATFCSKYISDYRSHIIGDTPSALKLYYGECKARYLSDEPFIYKRR